MDAFSAQQLAQLRTRLLQMQAELNEQLQISKQATDVVELDQTMVGRVSRMDAMQQQSMALSTREKANLKLDEVKTALRTMTGDDYGYCRRFHCDDLPGLRCAWVDEMQIRRVVPFPGTAVGYTDPAGKDGCIQCSTTGATANQIIALMQIST